MTPLFFNPSTDGGLRGRYVQTFSPDDRILLEIMSSDALCPEVCVVDLLDGSRSVVNMLSWAMNPGCTLYFATLCGMPEGLYSVDVGGVRSEPFRISGDVSGTVLLQYSCPDNRTGTDAVFVIDGMQHFFDFRIPGGFKDDDWVFGVDNEQYTTSENDAVDVYSAVYTQKALTVGNSCGCPVWYAEKLNMALNCRFFYVDGIRYSRAESNVPEMNVLVEGIRSYVFKQTLRRVLSLDPELEERNRMLMRRADDSVYRSVGGEDYKFKIIDI